MKEQIEALIRGALEQPVDFAVEYPADLAHGDFASNVALIAGKLWGQNPKEVAEKLAAKILASKPDWLAQVEVAGPGFINLKLVDRFFVDKVGEILQKGDSYGASTLGSGKKVVVEYSSPNIAKPFTVGHLRSTVIGDAIARILQFSGYRVIKDNHIGDWGTQFGKQLAALKKWGNDQEIESNSNRVKALVALYVKFHEEAEKNPELEQEAREWFRRLEEGDNEANEMHRKCVFWSFNDFKKIYNKLGVEFDNYSGEHASLKKVPEVYSQLAEKELMKKSEGAEVVFLDEYNLPPLIVRKSDGTSIYAVRDLATDLMRLEEYGKDVIIINEVGVEQSLYFKQIFATEKKLGWFDFDQRIHVAHGLYRFKDGKMSTRKGNVIWLEDIISELEKRAQRKIVEGDFGSDYVSDAGIVHRNFSSSLQGTISENEKVELLSSQIAIGALKYNDLKRDSSQDIVFDYDDILNLRGNSGPYLQYTYVRAFSVLSKSRSKAGESVCVNSVTKLLERFPSVVNRAAIEYAPHYVASYLYELASAFNSYYAQNKIIGSADESAQLAFVAATAQVLKNGLSLLGIPVPEKM